MRLYDSNIAPNPKKLRVYLKEKGLDIPIVPLDIVKGENRTPEFLQKNPLGGQVELVKSYAEADARIGWHAAPGTEISISGFNLLHTRHIEANDPSTYLPQYIPRTVLLTVRQSL